MQRGYELLEGSEDAPAKAAPIDLPRGTSTRDAFKVIGLACLKQVIDNAPALLAGKPEGVHQMRVGLRRRQFCLTRRTRAVDRSREWHGVPQSIYFLSPARHDQWSL